MPTKLKSTGVEFPDSTTQTTEGVTSVTAGNALTGGGSGSSVTINHADTSSQASVSNSGSTFIQDVTLDAYGHVTGLNSTSVPDSDKIIERNSSVEVIDSGTGRIDFTVDATHQMRVLRNGVDIFTGDEYGLQIGTHNKDSVSDIALTANAVIGGESSTSFTVGSAGHFSWQIGATSNTSGLDGATEVARIQTNGDFNFDSGYGSAATAYGCRAWVNFDGTGTVAIRESGNVSSITDNGAGDYTVNFANSMPDARYAMFAMAGDNIAGTHQVGQSQTSSAARLRTTSQSNNNVDNSRMTFGVIR